jgi:two-component system, OmpR family, sensor histidine kinase VicK
LLGAHELPGAKALETKQTQIESIQFAGPNHRRNHWALFKASPVIDEDNNVEYVVNVLTDITDLKQTEKQLELYKERFELAQKSGSVGVFEWDIQNDSMWWSTGEEMLFKIPTNTFKDDFVDRKTLTHWQDRVHPMDRKSIREKLSEAVKKQQAHYENEFRIVYPDGEVRWLKSSARIYYSKKGVPLRMVGVNYDITERIRKEQRKDEFISMASHELKTPLTSIKAFNQMMLKKIEKNEVNAGKFKDYLDRMGGQVNKLTKLIADLLDVTKIQQGALQLDREASSLNELVHEVVTTFRQTYDTHSIELIMEDELIVDMDSHRIEQVITNLLTNAVKYSPDGTTIVVTVKKDDDNAVLSVKDQGIGIPEEHQEHVTKRFYRVEKDDETKYPGLGIGLYISQQVVEQHQGRLWLESKKNEGSTFYVSIPIHSKDRVNE